MACAPPTRPEGVVAAVRREVAALDPAIPVLQTLTMADQFDNNIAQERMLTTLGGFFGASACQDLRLAAQRSRGAYCNLR